MILDQTPAQARKAALWLRQHGHGENRLAKIIGAFFQEQAAAIADELLNFARPFAGVERLLLRVKDENRKFWQAVSPELLRLMLVGAQNELERLPSGKGFKAAAETFDPFDLSAIPNNIYAEMPPELIFKIRAHLRRLESQAYWEALQSETQHNLANLIQSGLQAGETTREIASDIKQVMGSDRARAMKIARTETTASLNAGHASAMESAAAEGSDLITGKQWLGIGDDRQRLDHSAADGQTVGPKALFSVGGHQTPYPGHYSLPAEQRVNCRCTLISRLAEL